MEFVVNVCEVTLDEERNEIDSDRERVKFDDLRSLITELSGYEEVSIDPVVLEDMTGREWASYVTEDYSTGYVTEYSIHIHDKNGKRLKPHQLYRIFKLAGFTKG